MVKIRLKRMGRKKKPFYKIVAADARSPRDGRFIESLGYYDPNLDPVKISLKDTRVLYWLKSGAKPTDTVYSLLKYEGLVYRNNLLKRKFSKEQIDEAMAKFIADREYRNKKTAEKKTKLKAAKKAKKEEPKQA